MEESSSLENKPYEVILRPFRDYLKKVWKQYSYPPFIDLGDLKTSGQLIFGDLAITPKDLKYDKELGVLMATIYKFDKRMCEIRVTGGQELKYEFATENGSYKPLSEDDVEELLDL